MMIAMWTRSDRNALARRSSRARGSDVAGSARRRTNDELGEVVGCTEDGRGDALIRYGTGRGYALLVRKIIRRARRKGSPAVWISLRVVRPTSLLASYPLGCPSAERRSLSLPHRARCPSRR